MNEAWVIAPWQPMALPVAGGGRFPVRQIYCVGRNYADHAREMGADPDREPPFFFRKSLESLVPGGGTIAYPSHTHDLHHEVELVVAIGGTGADIAADHARDLVFGYAVGIDLTRRDLQSEAKSKSRPWDFAKGFPGAAPVGAIVAASEIGHPDRGAIRLRVNGSVRQDGDISQMIWRIDETLAILSGYQPLMPGDLVFTGTPAGVGTLSPGDQAEGTIETVGTVAITIA